MNESEKQSGIRGRLIGEDGNLYHLSGLAIRALKRDGRADLIEPMTEAVFASKSYEKALTRIMEYVEGESARRFASIEDYQFTGKRRDGRRLSVSLRKRQEAGLWVVQRAGMGGG